MRNVLVLLLLLALPACELIGDIFQAGLVVGIIIVLLIVALVGWLLSKFRGRRT